MSHDPRRVPALDPSGFNELRMCKTGPMLYNKHDIYVGGSLAKYGEFSVAEQELFAQIVRPGMVVVEVGANIGAHTVDLARRVGSAGRVYAFEPQRIVFQTLCANLALNQCTNVYASQVAVGAASGSIVVPAVDPAVRNNFGGVTLIDAQAGETVPLVTLDSLDLPACHLLKADVEGMEIEVLAGAQRTIDSYRPFMFLENDRAERSEALLTRVAELGYQAYWHLAFLFNASNWAGDREDIFGRVASMNILCVPREMNAKVQGLRPVTSPKDWLAAP
jgi:FkbM family methyltransferase